MSPIFINIHFYIHIPFSFFIYLILVCTVLLESKLMSMMLFTTLLVDWYVKRESCLKHDPDLLPDNATSSGPSQQPIRLISPYLHASPS